MESLGIELQQQPFFIVKKTEKIHYKPIELFKSLEYS